MNEGVRIPTHLRLGRSRSSPQGAERAQADGFGPRASAYGELPPKDQIQAIRIRQDPFAPDSMGAGQPRVEIITRPGSNNWTHEVNVGFRDQSLDARQAFAPERGEGQTRRLSWSASGPLVKDRASIAARLSTRDSFDAQTISLPVSATDLTAEWGPASYDVPHRVFGTFRTQLPFGLRLNLFGSLSSGRPYTITTGFDDNADTVFNDRPAGVGRNTERGAWQRNLDLRLAWRPLGNVPERAAGAAEDVMAARAVAAKPAAPPREAWSSTRASATCSTRPTTRATPAC